MRKIVVLEHISLDGVIQSPGGATEDTSDGFACGGWIAPFSDAALGAALRTQMNKPFDLLLGRKTYDIWAPYWPQHTEAWPHVNTATKYIASNNLTSAKWQPSVILSGDVAAKVAQIKQQPGADLHVWGSSQLLQTLIRQDLVDTFWLMIYPLTLGTGKRLFTSGGIPLAFQVTENLVTPKGVVVVNYERVSAFNCQ